MNREFVTLGVYGATESEFFARLQHLRIQLFVDIRARRGMRGSEYAFANRTRLETRLHELGIGYLHATEFAPTADIRDAQRQADAASGQAKRTRAELGETFQERFRNQVLAKADFEAFVEKLGPAERVALFCVERRPEACHRSLVAEELARRGIGKVVHWTS